MTKRISELLAVGAISDLDEFEINHSGASRKATRGQIVAGLASATHQHTLADITDSGGLPVETALATLKSRPRRSHRTPKRPPAATTPRS